MKDRKIHMVRAMCGVQLNVRWEYCEGQEDPHGESNVWSTAQCEMGIL